MKKVLVIANLYHASPRIPGISTYLSDSGWEATIITPSVKGAENKLGFPKQFLERVKIVEANFRGDVLWFWRAIFKLVGFKTTESITEQIKEQVGVTSKKSLFDKMMVWYQTFFAYPDTEITWQKPALKVASKLLQKKHFDIILSSSPHPTSHIVASKLKKKFKIPWVADYRDPWTQNHCYPFCKLRKNIEERLEKKILKHVDYVVAAAPSYAEKQKRLLGREVEVITNGFDQNDLNIPPTFLTDKFTMTYTGTIYGGKQDPTSFFTAVEKLITEKKINLNNIEIRFYGPRQKWIGNLISKHNLNGITKQYGTVSRNESIQKQKESQVLLLLNWEDSTEKGVYPLKFFEYLSAQRPILATGGFSGDGVEKIINETGSGIYAETLQKIEDAILNYYNEYKKNGKLLYNGNLKEINKYSYRELAKQFADILPSNIGELMNKSFYQAETPKEALEIYFQGEKELYAQVKNKTIKQVLNGIYNKGNWQSIQVLEIGAAGGIWTNYFTKHGTQVTCVDVSLQILKGNKKLNPQAIFILADATIVQLEKKFDLIFAKDIIEHIKDDEKFLKNMNGHLKDDELLLINTQNSFCLNYLIQGGYHFLRGNKNWYGWDPTHVRFYNKKTLKKKLQNAGFTPIIWFGSYYFPYRMIADHFGKLAESKIFCFIEYIGLYDKFPFNVIGWNIGVVARKTKSILEEVHESKTPV
jgi:2-polyprenyl-3-methyl-5-hydroxy-6-metoxy-1,4-benzoquinol methylase